MVGTLRRELREMAEQAVLVETPFSVALFERVSLAFARRVIEEAAKVAEGYEQNYPEDIFPEPPSGEHGRTIDTCSARALRRVLPLVIRDIRALGASLGETERE